MNENLINDGIGNDILTTTPYNGEEIRRAYETKPWPSDQEINGIKSEQDDPQPEPEPPTSDNYLTFTSRQDGSSIQLVSPYVPGQDGAEAMDELDLYYSLDGGETWERYENYDDDGYRIAGDTIYLDKEESVKFRGTNTSLARDSVYGGGMLYWKFVMDGRILASGDVTSLLNNVGGDEDLTEHYGRGHFSLNYYALPYLFKDCTALMTPPNLPSTILSNNCYLGMFEGCTFLESAPELNATNLSGSCYSGMFSGCSNLNEVTCLATDISASNCTSNWLSGVAASGTFIKHPDMTGWTSGNSGIPNGWTTENYVEE